ncbi:MAG: OpgC domain-containing protein [Janthinobacterium lividum]
MATRSVALDFFRGLAMLVIVVDHIGGSILSRYTLHAFAFPDAAEAFVFLSGYALAGAWRAWCRRDGEQASRRLLRRLWPIYRGFLICAGAMLAIAALCRAVDFQAPNLPMADLDALRDAPATYLLDLLLLRHQPYLASVLPMYLVFVAAAPVVLPMGLRWPVRTFAVSALVWTFADGGVLTWLASAGGDAWAFNPFAWQWMFVIGVVARAEAVRCLFAMPASRHGIGGVALAVVLGCAAWRLWIAPGYLDPELKRNLAVLRVLNFTALAWLGAMAGRFAGQRAWSRATIRPMRWVATIGRHSMASYIAGSAISLVVDTLLYRYTGGRLDYPAGLLADGVAVAASAGFASWIDRRRALAPTPAPLPSRG